MKVSKGFEIFVKEMPEIQKSWANMIMKISENSKLDKKTLDLAYIAVLASHDRQSGIPFHVQSSIKNGATKEEIISSALVGLPAVGNIVLNALPTILDSLDNLDN